jgi:hypothetical protein
MRVHTTLFLASGLPGITATLALDDDAFLPDYLERINLRPRSESNDLLDIVAAPTLVVQLSYDDGVPAGTLTWVFGRVRWKDFVGDDVDHALVKWYGKALDDQGLPPGWQPFLEAPPPPAFEPIRGVPPAATPPRCSAAPPDWLDGPWLDNILGNNCYNYAANVAPDGHGVALPGKGTSNVISRGADADELRRGCAADKLRFLRTLPSTCPDPGGHIVALINRADSRGGFHFFRLNRDQTWSHKDGPRAARNTDDAGRRIINLERASFGYRFEFVGYFHCPPDHEVD